MPRRYRLSNPGQHLFSNVPIESGRTDQDIVHSCDRPFPHKTFSRLRLNPPSSATADQLLLIARLVQRHTPFSAADYLSLARCAEGWDRSGLWALAVSRTKPRSPKDLAVLDQKIQSWLPKVRRIYLFDRHDSFAYLRPWGNDEESQDASDEITDDVSASLWSDSTIDWRYDRRPRVSVTLTTGSVGERQASYGDAGIEALIGNAESGEHSLVVVNDGVRIAHRVFRSVFADAAAVAIFDAKRMIVLPSHGRAIRTYDVDDEPAHRPLIAQAVLQLRVMRRFRSSGLRQGETMSRLRELLSYRLPAWSSA